MSFQFVDKSDSILKRNLEILRLTRDKVANTRYDGRGLFQKYDLESLDLKAMILGHNNQANSGVYQGHQQQTKTNFDSY